MLQRQDRRRRILRAAMVGALIALLSAVSYRLSAQGEGQKSASAAKQPPATSGDWTAFQKNVQPFLAKHCVECHGDKKKSGDVRLDAFHDATSLGKGVATLEKAEAMLRKHAMPPPKRPQPSDNEIKAVLAWLDRYLTQVDQKLATDPGRSVIRRLNKTEYNNTIRDLLGVKFQPADEFPPDDAGLGFDNIGSVLSMSPTLMEKYLTAAEKVARTALFGHPAMKPEIANLQPWYADLQFSTNQAVKHDYDETGIAVPNSMHVWHRFPVDGEYNLSFVIRGQRPPGSNPLEIAFWVDGKMVKEAKVITPKGLTVGQSLGYGIEYRGPFTEGEHWIAVTFLRMYEGLPPDYKGPNPAKTTKGKGPGRGATDAFMVSNIDVAGPYNQAKGPSKATLTKIFMQGAVEGKRDPSLAPKILADLARRAYRRPVTDQEVDELVKLVHMVQKDGDSYEEGLCLAIQKILISPHFLYRVEKTPAAAKDKDAHPISQHELASRLSYFLWSSMPDEELLACADKQTLRDPKVLETQVKRMLSDPKADALVVNFGGQWLHTRGLESHTPDRGKFQEFTEYTRMSMKQETELFFAHIMRDDRSILDFVDAKWTFLNRRLAEFYGIPGIKGHEFRKVDLTGTQRGGVWTHGSVLTVSSYTTRTSPVLRGKWILENLLNAPPPPPPADVPDLVVEKIGSAVTLRQQLEKHRADPACASCHARMDPLGFALENFDANGKWRDKEGKLTIDSSGELPGGKPLKGPEGLRAFLRSEPNAFAECLTEKMLIYALGRGLQRSDRYTVKTISQRLAKNEYRFSNLIMGIVESTPFQMRRVEPKK